MGVEISLHGPAFDKTGWRRDLTGLIDSEEWPLMALAGLLLEAEDNDLLLAEGEAGEPAPDAQMWILTKGGIRGVTIKNDPEGIVLSMPTGTGARDWELAAALASSGVERGAQVSIDAEPWQTSPGRPVDLSEVFDDIWSFGVQAIRSSVERSEEGAITLPVLYNLVHLELSAEEAASETLHDDLVARMDRYGEAFLASNLQFEMEDGRMVDFNVAGVVPTLIDSESDGIILHDSPADPTGHQEPLFGGKPVPTPAFIEIMGDRIERVGPRYYVPLYTYSADPELYEALQEAAESYGSGAGPAPAGEEGGDQRQEIQLTEEQAAALASGPILVFLMVAGADGEIDEEEIRTFLSLLANSEMVPGAVLQHMLTQARENFQALYSSIAAGEVTPPELMTVMLGALEQCPPEESRLARQGLYVLAQMVADASGEAGDATNISEREQAVLEMLEKILDVNPNEIGTPGR